MKIFYSPRYTIATHSFETTRKSGWIAESLAREPIAGIELVAPEPTSAAALSRVHDPEYVDAVRTGNPRELAESQGFHWDPALWEMVCASNGGLMAAAIEALRTHRVSGSLSSGLHHARRARGAGYCTFNGLVLAAGAALDAGARTVLILDLDAHCGGGTHELIHGDERIWQMDVSVNAFDRYEPLGNNQLDILLDIWKKFVLLSGTSGITASTRQPLGVIRDDKDMRAFFYKLMQETIAVGRAAGVEFSPDFPAELDRSVAAFPPMMKASIYV